MPVAVAVALTVRLQERSRFDHAIPFQANILALRQPDQRVIIHAVLVPAVGRGFHRPHEFVAAQGHAHRRGNQHVRAVVILEPVVLDEDIPLSARQRHVLVSLECGDGKRPRHVQRGLPPDAATPDRVVAQHDVMRISGLVPPTQFWSNDNIGDGAAIDRVVFDEDPAPP